MMVFSIILVMLALMASTGCAMAAIGTREDPIPMGTTVDLGDGWQIAMISVIPDATNAVLKENQFNDPPKPGNQFFLARVRAKYTGQGSDTFGGSYRLRAVGPSSVGYSTFENSPGVIPDPLPDSEVFSGGVIEGNIGWEIKSSDASSLVMYDNPVSFGGNKDRVYLALYGQGAIRPQGQVDVTVYVHEGNLNGTLLSGVHVTGLDGAGIRFEGFTDSNGTVIITGMPGSWRFAFIKEGYEMLELLYAVNETHRGAVYLKKVGTT
jgi:hypothetical protein